MQASVSGGLRAWLSRRQRVAAIAWHKDCFFMVYQADSLRGMVWLQSRSLRAARVKHRSKAPTASQRLKGFRHGLTQCLAYRRPTTPLGRVCSQPGDRQQQRARKLQSLYEALQAGDLDHARQAFLALINLDPLATSDPVLSKIGAALQSSNLPAARQHATELNVRGGSFLAKFAQKIDDVMPAKPMFMLDDLGVAHVDFKA